MDPLENRYINPYTDYGFKYLFGTEPNKDITLAFLNALLQGREKIKYLKLLPAEQLGDTQEDRRAVFDVYCENENGDKIIIEMQKADQQFFKDRSVYYSSFPIRSQGAKGRWRFGLKAVYTIGILDFVFDEDKDNDNYFNHVVQLMDVNTKKVFYDNLTYIYLEMPKFRKTEDQLVTLTDKWLYALKNLPRLLERPKALQERIFAKFFKVAEVANFSKEEYAKYIRSENNYYDWDSIFRTAEKKGREEGLAQGMAQGIEKGMAQGIEKGMAQGIEKGMAQGIEKGMVQGIAQGIEKGKDEAIRDNARRMKSDGMPPDLISKYTGLSVDEILTLGIIE